jgi:hypothetical protein
MSSDACDTPEPAGLRDHWMREVLAAADTLRHTGHHKRLRDVTIVLPIDLLAVEAIELACMALAEGELSDVAGELRRFLDRLSADPAAAERFLASVHNVVARVRPLPQPP